MITLLSNLRQLVDRQTSSVLPFSAQHTLQAGRALNVDSVLEGSIQKQGDRVRVTVRLLRVNDGQPLMALQCDEQCTDIFALQDAISSQVTEALALQLTIDERQRMMKSYTANAEAFHRVHVAGVHAEEPLEHVLQVLFLDADAVVLHRQA